MNKEFVPYEQALAFKELGFDEPCFATYDEDRNFELQDFLQTYETFPSHIVAAPTFSQAFRWFREKHDLWSEIHVEDNVRFGEQKYYWNIFGKYISYEGNNWIRAIVDSNGVMSNTYEEAELACLKKLIEIIKQ